ncbi:MAG: hypothetical protein HKM89_07030 [Gemmatimonadales bacterium]|nr:hypothetical protein [Gemmatimonadales bacterium]
MTRLFVALIAALILVACSDTTEPSFSSDVATVSQAKDFNEWTPWQGTLWNACHQESMDFDGKRKRLRTVTEDGNGGFHFNFHRNWHGTAIGQQSGNVYNINFPINWTENSRGPYPYVFNRVWYNNITCRGKCATQLFRTKYHLTINANGEVTSEKETWSIECKGP